jgi:hypothetical protein
MKEFGIRLALGATGSRIVRDTLASSMKVGAYGVVARRAVGSRCVTTRGLELRGLRPKVRSVRPVAQETFDHVDARLPPGQMSPQQFSARVIGVALAENSRWSRFSHWSIKRRPEAGRSLTRVVTRRIEVE